MNNAPKKYRRNNYQKRSINFFQGGYICRIILKTFFFLDLMENRLLNIWKSVCSRRKRCKNARAIRYFHYCVWARECLKRDIGSENTEYGYPESVLSFIRRIAPEDIVGEIRDRAFQVTLEIFCRVMNIPRIDK